MTCPLLVLLVAQAGDQVTTEDPVAKSKPTYTTASLRGEVVWLRDEIAKTGIKLAAEIAEGNLVLKESDGSFHPLMEDRRGHAFRLDPRLRSLKLELLVRRFQHHPYLQVLKVYEVGEDEIKRELVYWCEICAITMFELKPCDCCQGQIELQRRKVKQ